MDTPGSTDGAGRGFAAAVRARPTNSVLRDFLAGRAREEEGHRSRAIERAWRAAMFSCTEEAAALADQGRPLTDLQGVGPWLAGVIEEWLDRAGRDEDEGPAPDRPSQGFLSRAGGA